MYPSLPYHRGHLVQKKTYSSTPNSVRSTYTYTNAVPQRPAFNSGQWAQFEKRIRRYAKTCTYVLQGKLYLLTGTSFAQFGPGDLNPAGINPPAIDKLEGYLNDFISIPNSMWTAGCCVAQDDKNTRNFAVIGNNVQGTAKMYIQQIIVKVLEDFLLNDVKRRKIGGPYFLSLFPENVLCRDKHRNVILH